MKKFICPLHTDCKIEYDSYCSITLGFEIYSCSRTDHQYNSEFIKVCFNEENKLVIWMLDSVKDNISIFSSKLKKETKLQDFKRKIEIKLPYHHITQYDELKQKLFNLLPFS